MLQRGRGAGVLWALDAPREDARSALIHCVIEDPRPERWDTDLATYYADLWVFLEMDPADMKEPVLDPARTFDDLELAFHVLLEIARCPRSGGPALELLREWALSGKRGWDVLLQLSFTPLARGTLDDLLGRFLATVPDDGDLRGLLRWRSAPGRWFEEGGRLHHPRLRDASRSVLKERGEPAGLPPDISGVPLDRLLGRQGDAGDTWQRIQREIRRRNAPADREALLRLAVEEGDPLVRAMAFRVLRGRRIPGAFAAADAVQDLPGPPPVAYLARMAGYYLDCLPAEATLPWARKWVCSIHPRRRWAASWLLARHATAADFQLLAQVVEARLAEDPIPSLGPEGEALGRTGVDAARPLLERMVRECPGTATRNMAVRGLARLPGGLPPDIAYEGLWDASRGVRSVSIPMVALDRPLVVERLHHIAAGKGPLEQGLCESARARLTELPRRSS